MTFVPDSGPLHDDKSAYAFVVGVDESDTEQKAFWEEINQHHAELLVPSVGVKF